MGLIDAAQAMCAGATDDRVGLVLRLNGDDSRVTTLWSESSKKHDGTNPPVADRPMMFRFNDDDDNSKGIRAALPIDDVAGYHAEEILIATWPKLLAESGLSEDKLSRVDIVLSKSPCIESSPLIVRGGSMEAPHDCRFGKGCAEKLRVFCAARPNVSFNIHYVALAGAKAGNYEVETKPVGERLQRWMTAEEKGHLEPARQALPKAYGDFIASDETLSVLRECDELLTPVYQDLIDSTSEKDKKREYASELKATLNSTRSYEKALNAAKKKLQMTEDLARKKSLNNAQRGLVRLDALANVSIERWRPGQAATPAHRIK